MRAAAREVLHRHFPAGLVAVPSTSDVEPCPGASRLRITWTPGDPLFEFDVIDATDPSLADRTLESFAIVCSNSEEADRYERVIVEVAPGTHLQPNSLAILERVFGSVRTR